MSPFVRVIRVYEDETVEIQWRCADGTVFTERRTIPPKATRAAQHQPTLQLADRAAEPESDR
jgi:hypothetical protein